MELHPASRRRNSAELLPGIDPSVPSRKRSKSPPAVHSGPASPRLRWLIAALAVAIPVAIAVRVRSDRARPPAVPAGAAAVRAVLRLDPVLAAEEAVAARPDDAAARRRIVEACLQADDPAGAALALYPLSRAGGDAPAV